MSALQVRIGRTFENLKRQGQRSIRMRMANLMIAAMKDATKVILSSTPVWMGETMANYNWSLDTPMVNSPIQFRDHDKASGDWWLTSSETITASDFSSDLFGEVGLLRNAIFSNPFRKVYLTNNVRYEEGMKFSDLESGVLTGTPYPITAEIRRVVKDRLNGYR